MIVKWVTWFMLTWLRTAWLEIPASIRRAEVIFLFATAPFLGPTETPVRWVPDALPSEVKRPGRAASHSAPSIPMFKKAWRYKVYIYAPVR